MSVRQLPEFVIRRLYFSSPSLVDWYQRHKARGLQRHSSAARWDPKALRHLLLDHIPPKADLMLHASMAGLGRRTPPLEVFNLFRDLCGGRRTLLVPFHPVLGAGADGVLEYDPASAPASIGLVPELARRTRGFLRSRHPFSSVAAEGPDASSYLENNLNDQKPLPHGIYSPYARIAERGGYAVCLGIPFDECLTMIHVSEESLDQAFPRAIRFEEVRVRVGGEETYTVRLRSSKMRPYFSMWSIRRDLPTRGVVRRFGLSGVLVDLVDCRALVLFMRTRALETGYPYVFLPRRREGRKPSEYPTATPA